jgi:PAS domain S-box-containing protein
MRRIGVRSYLFLVLSLMSTAPVAWLGTLETSRLSRIAVNEADRHARGVAFDVARAAGVYVDRQVRAIETLAAQIDPAELGDPPQLQQLLDGLLEHTGGYTMVYLGDAHGMSLVAAPKFGADGLRNTGASYGDRQYFRQLATTRQTVVSAAEIGRRTGQPSLHVAVRLRSRTGGFDGYVAGAVGLSSVQQIVASCLKSSPDTQAVLVDQSSSIITDSRRSPRGTLSDVSASLLFRATNQPERRIARDEHGEVMRASAVPVESETVRWSVVAFRPEAETQVVARAMRRSTLTVSAWAVLVALVVAYFLSRWLARPITELVRVTKRVDADLELEPRLEPSWGDPEELVELGNAVDQMLAHEQQHKASLNELVRERTEELEAANHQLAVLAIALENAGDAICMTDIQGHVEWTNPAFRRTTGYFPGESTGKHLAELLGITGSFFEFGDCIVEQSVEQTGAGKGGGSTWRSPVRSRVRDGTVLDLDLAISPVLDSQGNPQRYVAVARDVTARLKAAQEIADSEARYRTLVEHAPEAVVVLDASAGHFVDSNVQAEKLFRRVRHHLMRTDIAGLSPAEQPDGRASAAAAKSHVDATLCGDTPFFEWTFVDSHGMAIPCEVRLVGLPSAAAQLVRASIVNISERLRREQEQRELQKRLDGTERLAGIGAVAAGVAHEVNNPLTYILNNLDYALALGPEPALPKAIRDALIEAQSGALRVRDIVRDLKTFARVEGETQAPIDVRTVMDSSINIASSELIHRARIIKEYRDIPEIIADPSRLGQVFLNLIANAIQALPEGSPSEQLIRVEVLPAADAQSIEVNIEDTGHGIPADRIERIFEPFYTTKPIGKGTGLGLSISRNTVTSMGGHIDVTSQLGKGTRFTVVLPLRRERAADMPPSDTPSEAPLSSRLLSILVLDDDVMVARSIARTIGTQHKVTICTRGSEALDLVSQWEFDLVFCDVMMPEMSGLEFLSRLRSLQPALAKRLVFMTGGLFIPDIREQLDQLQNLCISKPFQPGAVLDAIRRSMRLPCA